MKLFIGLLFGLLFCSSSLFSKEDTSCLPDGYYITGLESEHIRINDGVCEPLSFFPVINCTVGHAIMMIATYQKLSGSTEDCPNDYSNRILIIKRHYYLPSAPQSCSDYPTPQKEDTSCLPDGYVATLKSEDIRINASKCQPLSEYPKNSCTLSNDNTRIHTYQKVLNCDTLGCFLGGYSGDIILKAYNISPSSQGCTLPTVEHPITHICTVPPICQQDEYLDEATLTCKPIDPPPEDPEPCTTKSTDFQLSSNEKIIETWLEDEHDIKSIECNELNAIVKNRIQNCQTVYGCAKKDLPTPEPDCKNVHMGSYVSPSDSSFHEDIAIIGSDVDLHYSSNISSDDTIATGWSLTLHHSLNGNYLNLGYGSLTNIESKKEVIDGITTITYGASLFLFDADNNHIATKDTFTKKTLYSFAYDSNSKLISITDDFNNITTIQRDANGVVTSITAPNGQVNYLLVDINNDLAKVTYEDNSAYIFTYDNHLMISEKEPNSNEFLHIFDENGKVTSVVDAQSATWGFSKNITAEFEESIVNKAAGDTITYKDYYLNNNALVSETISPSGDIFTQSTAIDGKSSSSQSCGVLKDTTYQIDSLTKQTIPSSITTTQPSGLSSATSYTQTYTYDNDTLIKKDSSVTSNGDITQITRDYALSNATTISPEGRVSVVTYDENTLLPLEFKNTNLQSVVYTYDEKGRVINITQGQRVLEFTYDSRGNLESQIDNAKTTLYNYDEKDRLTQTTYPTGESLEFAYDANGNRVRLTTPTPTDHMFEYNGVNKRTSYNSPLNYQTLYEYDDQRRVTKITRASGNDILNTYDEGQLKSISTPDGTTYYDYDCGSKVSSITNDSESISYTYDGDLLTSQQSDGILNQTINYTYNNNFEVTNLEYAGDNSTYTYDKDGYLTGTSEFTITRDPLNALVTNISDSTLNISKTYNNFGELNTQESNNFNYTLTRDNSGKIIEKTENRNNTSSIRHLYEYDDRDRLISSNIINMTTYEDAQDGTTSKWHIYDTSPDGATISNVYDEDKQSNVMEFNGDGINNGYKTDGWNNTTDKTVKWSMKFSENYSIFIKMNTIKGYRYLYYTPIDTDKGLLWGNYIQYGLGSNTRDGSWQTITRDIQADLQEYESDNEIIHIEGFSVRGSGRVDDIVTIADNGSAEYTYDANGNRLSSTTNSITTTALYTLDDSLEVYGDNTYRYNDDGYLIEKITPHESISYAYNTLGALSEVNILKAQNNKWRIYDNTPAGATISNVYDEDKQSNVIEFNGDGINNGYKTDGWNNTTDKTVKWSMKFSENYSIFIKMNTIKGYRYLYYTPIDTDKGLLWGNYIQYGLGSNTRDGSWQTITRDIQADLQEYESDNEIIHIEGFSVRGSGRVDDITTISQDSQITVYEDAEALKNTQIIYHLNALNQRVAKEVNGVITEKYLWQDLTTLLATYNPDDTLKQRYNYTTNRMPTSMTQDNQTYYLHYDQVGTLRVVTDINNNIIKEVTYDTFGNILHDTNINLQIPFGFAGGMHDRDTELVHFGYREYDPFTGKWAAKDPIGFDGGDANLYGYVLGDPVNFIDPEGLMSMRMPRGSLRLPSPKRPFPGYDPSKSPFKGFEWRGKPNSKPGDKNGNYYNPKTGESCRPDLDHPKPIGPHWDYKSPAGEWYRIHPDGSMVPKGVVPTSPIPNFPIPRPLDA